MSDVIVGVHRFLLTIAGRPIRTNMERTEDEDRRGSLEEGLGGAESVVRTEEMIGSEDEASTVSDERRNCTLCRYPRTVEYCGGHHIPSGRPRAEPANVRL